MEPIFIEDVPSPMIEEIMNQLFESSFSTTIPIIEDVEALAKTNNETPPETLVETRTKTQPT